LNFTPGNEIYGEKIWGSKMDQDLKDDLKYIAVGIVLLGILCASPFILGWMALTGQDVVKKWQDKP
jgi:hypothetical protein